MAILTSGYAPSYGDAYPKLSKKLRIQAQRLMKLRQFVKPEPGFGKNKGDTVAINKFSAPARGSRVLSELAPMPVNSIKQGQLLLTVQEYGTSLQYTGKKEDLADYNVNDPFQKALKLDMAVALDAMVGDQFVATDVSLKRSNGTILTNGTTEVGTTALTTAILRMMVAWLEEGNNITPPKEPTPYYDEGNNYILVGSPNLIRGLLDDTSANSITDVGKYAHPEDIYNGEIGMYDGVRIIKENNYFSNPNGVGAGVLFGDDPVVEVVAVPEEIRYQEADYQRAKGVAWYYLGGAKIMWLYSDPTIVQPRIIYIP